MSHFHQNKLKKRMSHLVLMAEAAAVDPEVSESEVEQSSDEHRPLLRAEEASCSTSSSQREDAKVTTNYSLVPDASLPAQVKKHDAGGLPCSLLLSSIEVKYISIFLFYLLKKNLVFSVKLVN